MLLIRGAEGWTDEQLLEALDRGGRVHIFERTTSIVAITLTERVGAVLVMQGESLRRHALGPSLWTFLLGWWALYGLLITPIVLFKNLVLGGEDITALVRDSLLVRRLQRAEEAAAAAARAAEEDAGELVPDTPEACMARASEALDRGEPALARELLSFMLQRDGSPKDPALLVRLALAFHAREEFASAMSIFEVIVRDLTVESLTHHHRYLVRKCEAALGRTTSIVPPILWYQRPPVLVAVISMAMLSVVAILAVQDLWVRQHQELYLVNATREDVDAVIERPELPSLRISLQAGQKARLELAEDDLVVRLEHPGGRVERIEARVRSSVGRRLSGRSAFVVDVDGAGVYWCYDVAYGRAKVSRPARLHLLEPFFVEDDVDHAFTTPPETLRVSRDRGEVRKVLSQYEGKADDIAVRLGSDGVSAEMQLDYLEHHVRLAPGDARLGQAYSQLARVLDRQERATTFLGTLEAGARPR